MVASWLKPVTVRLFRVVEPVTVRLEIVVVERVESPLLLSPFKVEVESTVNVFKVGGQSMTMYS